LIVDTTVTVIQRTEDVAVHEQPVPVVTVIVPVDDFELTERLVEFNVVRQLPVPLWVTVTVCPPTATVAVRALLPVLTAAR
jgi:hypothetical protein